MQTCHNLIKFCAGGSIKAIVRVLNYKMANAIRDGIQEDKFTALPGAELSISTAKYMVQVEQPYQFFVISFRTEEIPGQCTWIHFLEIVTVIISYLLFKNLLLITEADNSKIFGKGGRLEEKLIIFPGQQLNQFINSGPVFPPDAPEFARSGGK